MFPTTPTRRTVLRAGAVVLSGSAASSPVIAVDSRDDQPAGVSSGGDETPPEAPPAGDEPPRDSPEARLWPRLYKGVAAVDLTYIRGFDRTATGEFDVDIEFSEQTGLEQPQNPFVLRLTPTALRGGTVIVSPPVGYSFSSDLERTEGALTINTDVGDARFWAFEYAAASGEISGQYSGLAEYGNHFGSLHELLFDESAVFASYLEAQSTFTGTITDDDLSLAFDLLDNELRVRCRATITASRIA